MHTTDHRDATIGSFVTRVVQTRQDGHQFVFLSRRQRKRLKPLHLNSGGEPLYPALPRASWLQFWAPRRLAWWIALLFIIGSACFAYASFAANWPQVLPSEMARASLMGVVFFVGSLFFTSAAALQLLEAINGDVADLGPSQTGHRPTWRWFAWKPRNAGYLASLIQLIGTLLFNLNTGDALLTGLNWVQEDNLIWVPNMAGSVCFLTASYLGLIEISHGWWSFEPRQVAWWIVIINVAGSVAFQISAFYGFFPPPPDAGWAWDANLWTFIGALCFFVASYLMLPELFDADATAPSKAVPSAAKV
jgi:hypothetical protein